MKICLLGFGRRGKTIYGHLTTIQGISVVGIYDPANTDPYPAPHFNSAKTMFTECDPDLVIDTSPSGYRLNNILLCDKFSVPIICEKPLIFSPKDLTLLKAINIPVYPAYQMNFDIEVKKFFELVSESPVQSAQFSQLVNLEEKGWRTDPALAGGGTLADNGSHLINLSIKNFGLPHSVFATVSQKAGVVDSITDAFLNYEDFLLKISVSWNSPVGKETALTVVTNSQRVHFVETHQDKSLSVNFSETVDNWTKLTEEHWFTSRGLGRNVKTDPYNQSEKDPTRTMLQDIINDVANHNGRSDFASREFRTALQTSKVINALYQAIEKETTVIL